MKYKGACHPIQCGIWIRPFYGQRENLPDCSSNPTLVPSNMDRGLIAHPARNVRLINQSGMEQAEMAVSIANGQTVRFTHGEFSKGVRLFLFSCRLSRELMERTIQFLCFFIDQIFEAGHAFTSKNAPLCSIVHGLKREIQPVRCLINLLKYSTRFMRI